MSTFDPQRLLLALRQDPTDAWVRTVLTESAAHWTPPPPLEGDLLAWANQFPSFQAPEAEAPSLPEEVQHIVDGTISLDLRRDRTTQTPAVTTREFVSTAKLDMDDFLEWAHNCDYTSDDLRTRLADLLEEYIQEKDLFDGQEEMIDVDTNETGPEETTEESGILWPQALRTQAAQQQLIAGLARRFEEEYE